MRRTAIGLLLLSLTSGCTYRNYYELLDDCAVRVTYFSDVKPVIDLNCAISGCHVAGFPMGDFTSYEGIQPKIASGRLKFLAIDQKIMPPAGRPPLDEKTLHLLSCWISQGAPER